MFQMETKDRGQKLGDGKELDVITEKEEEGLE